MSTICLEYSALNAAISQTGTLATALTTYSSEISSMVTTKLGSLPGSEGSTGYVSAASQAAAKKVSALSNMSGKATAFKSDLDSFLTNARAADDAVASDIKTTGDAVIGPRTTWEKVGDTLYNIFCVELVNSNCVLEAISNVIKAGSRKIGSIIEDVHTWFKYKGGKYILEDILVAIGVISAIAAAVVAVVTAGTVLAVIAAVASVILAVIAAVNGVIAIFNNHKAMKLYEEGKLGQARFSGSIESLSDYVAKTDMGSAEDNARWKMAGDVMDGIEVACEIVVAVNGAANLAGVKDSSGKIVKYSKDALKKNIKKSFGFTRKRYTIDPASGKKVSAKGMTSGYKVGDCWSLKDMFTSRNDGVGKQYVRKYFGFGATDSVFYNNKVIEGMAKNPAKTTQSVSKLFNKLSGVQKTSKVILDGSCVIKTTMDRVNKIDKISSGVQTMLNSQNSTWDRAKGGISALNAFNSEMNFMKCFDNAGKVTGLVDKGLKMGDFCAAVE